MAIPQKYDVFVELVTGQTMAFTYTNELDTLLAFKALTQDKGHYIHEGGGAITSLRAEHVVRIVISPLVDLSKLNEYDARSGI